MLIYATLDPDLKPVELRPGVSEPLYWQKVADEQEAAWSLTPVGEYARVDNSLPPVALGIYGPEDLDRLRIFAVTLPAAPAGQQLASYSLSM